jgi:hypothetical protein
MYPSSDCLKHEADLSRRLLNEIARQHRRVTAAPVHTGLGDEQTLSLEPDASERCDAGLAKGRQLVRGVEELRRKTRDSQPVARIEVIDSYNLVLWRKTQPVGLGS